MTWVDNLKSWSAVLVAIGVAIAFATFVSQQVDGAEARLTIQIQALSTRIDGLDERLRAVESKVDTLQTDMEWVKGALDPNQE